MKQSPQSVLLIIFKNKERATYSIPKSKTGEEVLKYAIAHKEIIPESVEKTIFFPSTFYNLEDIQYYYDDEKNEFDQSLLAIEFKLEEFRKQRNLLFSGLDNQFMRSLEKKDCEDCVNHIVNIKKHLRTMPNILLEHLEKLEIEDIISFDCFNNVYSINILNGGSGYETSPEITIEPPNGTTKGIQMEAEAAVSNGKVTEIKVTRIGSGYSRTPAVNVAKPESGNVAMCIASSPENDIFNVNK